jgi:hypothetical protein
MSVTITVDLITATTARLNYAGIDPAAVTIEIQIAPRLDFLFCAAPVFSTAAVTPFSIDGLNQSQTYYVRGRGITGAGAQLAWSEIESFRTPQQTAQDLTPPAVFLENGLVCIPEPVFSLTATTVAGYPIINTQDDGPAVAILTQDGFNNFAITFRTSGQPIDTIALLCTNMPEAVDIDYFQGDTFAEANAETNQFLNTSGRASANVPGRMHYHLFNRFTSTSKRWFKLKFNAAVLGKRLQIGHLIVGRSLQSKRIARDMSISFEDMGVVERSPIGVPDRQQGLRMRTVDLDFAMMTETIYETVYGPVHALIGETDPVLILPNSKAGAFLHDRLLYGTLTGGRASNPVSRYFSRRFQIRSII